MSFVENALKTKRQKCVFYWKMDLIRVLLRDAGKSNLDLGGRFTNVTGTLEAGLRTWSGPWRQTQELTWTLEAS